MSLREDPLILRSKSTAAIITPETTTQTYQEQHHHEQLLLQDRPSSSTSPTTSPICHFDTLSNSSDVEHDIISSTRNNDDRRQQQHDKLLQDYVMVDHPPSLRPQPSSSSLAMIDDGFLVINMEGRSSNPSEGVLNTGSSSPRNSSSSGRNSMEVHRKRSTVTLKRPPLPIDGIDLASYGTPRTGSIHKDHHHGDHSITCSTSSSSSSIPSNSKKSTSSSSSSQQQQYIEVKLAQATREFKQNLLNQTNVSTTLDSNTRDIVEPKEIIFLENFAYALIPDDVPYSDPLFLSQVERLKQIIEREYSEVGALAQFKRDAILWKKTLESPEYEALGNVLRRIFCVLRYGSLLYRENEKTHKWNLWNSTKYPIASVLSHGSRVIIQLDSMDGDGAIHHNGDEHSFWKWLVTYVIKKYCSCEMYIF